MYTVTQFEILTNPDEMLFNIGWITAGLGVPLFLVSFILLLLVTFDPEDRKWLKMVIPSVIITAIMAVGGIILGANSNPGDLAGLTTDEIEEEYGISFLSDEVESKIAGYIAYSPNKLEYADLEEVTYLYNDAIYTTNMGLLYTHVGEKDYISLYSDGESSERVAFEPGRGVLQSSVVAGQ